MATFENALFSLLTNDANLSAQIGNRVIPEILPEDATLPLITYLEILTETVKAHDGPTGLRKATYQLDCWAANPDGAVTLRQLVLAAVDGYRGTVAGIKIDGIQAQGVRGDPDRDLRMGRKIIELFCLYSEV